MHTLLPMRLLLHGLSLPKHSPVSTTARRTCRHCGTKWLHFRHRTLRCALPTQHALAWQLSLPTAPRWCFALMSTRSPGCSRHLLLSRSATQLCWLLTPNTAALPAMCTHSQACHCDSMGASCSAMPVAHCSPALASHTRATSCMSMPTSVAGARPLSFWLSTGLTMTASTCIYTDCCCV